MQRGTPRHTDPIFGGLDNYATGTHHDHEPQGIVSSKCFAGSGRIVEFRTRLGVGSKKATPVAGYVTFIIGVDVFGDHKKVVKFARNVVSCATGDII